MIWALLSAVLCCASCVATFLAAVKLWRDRPARASTVYWLLVMLCSYFSMFTFMRASYYTWLTIVVYQAPGGRPERSELDQLGIHAIVLLKKEQSWLVTVAVVAGDSALFAVFLWLFQLTYQLSSLLTQGMDEGEAREQYKIRRTAIVSHLSIAALFTAELSIGLRYGGYSRTTHGFLLSVYALQVATIIYMVAAVVFVKVKGRDVNAVDGERVVAPIYRRLEWILLVYAAAASQFQILSLSLFLGRKRNFTAWSWMGVSTIINNAAGLAVAFAIGCSQPCMLQLCGCLLRASTELDEHLLQEAASHYWWNEGRMAATERLLNGSVLYAPSTVAFPPQPRLTEMERPVFVYTDIESSSALWGIRDGRVMQEATEIHDTLMRSVLAKLGGYEIATAGDAFHLAFPTIQRAVLFCLTVQLRLMMTKWPKELHGLVPATRKVRARLRTVFRGLRVRMGIHCFDEADGPLVRSVHAVTGTVTYTGASAVITNTVGELAAGGQILVTAPIASWLRGHQEDVPIPFVMDETPVGDVCLSHSTCSCSGSQWGLFQLFPKRLARRCDLVTAAFETRRDSKTRLGCRDGTAPCMTRLSVESDAANCRDQRGSRLDSGTEALAVLNGHWAEFAADV